MRRMGTYAVLFLGRAAHKALVDDVPSVLEDIRVRQLECREYRFFLEVEILP